MADWHRFVRALGRAGFGQAWVRTLELHPGGHGFHVHAGLSRFVPKTLLAELWGHGFVDVRVLGPRGSVFGSRESSRAAARYLAKYAGKAAIAAPGEHSYEVAQGYPVVVVDGAVAESPGGVQGQIDWPYGSAPYVWDSRSDPAWRGPPAVFASW